MKLLAWIALAFSCGALPFSVWVGWLALHKDIRQYGDHNPGATNVGRAGGKSWGALALSLDMLKGAVPVGLAWYWAGLAGWPLVVVALAPILGHAYSPFLGFRGGKAVAVTLGVWGGLSFGLASLLLIGLFIPWYLIIAVDSWTVMLTTFSFLIFLLALNSNFTFLAIWAGCALLLGWKHRADLRQLPHLRPWLSRRLGL
jgi:glycerol-3-phosphate acyltransferase PlsY